MNNHEKDGPLQQTSITENYFTTASLSINKNKTKTMRIN